MSQNTVHVVVGVVVNRQGDILIAKRPHHAHQGGLWEFPGGKVEAGENVIEALQRELKEELAINSHSFLPIIQVAHDYADKSVLLDVYRVTEFTGKAQGNEGQPVRWVAPNNLYQYEFPAANKPIIRALTLPAKLLITGQYTNTQNFSERLTACLKLGITFVQLRAHQASDSEYSQCISLAESLCARFNAKLVLNRAELQLVKNSPHGRHLSSHELMKIETLHENASQLLGASCHNEGEILKANTLGLDYICLSPVKPTSSHPDTQTLDWSGFAKLVEIAKMPVYALGGMKEGDVTTAQKFGGQGVAAISVWW